LAQLPFCALDATINVYYNARHKDRQGHYIPNISVTSDNAWADWSNKIESSVFIENPSNVGSIDDPVPQLDLLVRINYGSQVLGMKMVTARIRVNGISGITALDNLDIKREYFTGT